MNLLGSLTFNFFYQLREKINFSLINQNIVNKKISI
jgi:hypothetical protein